MCVGGGGGGGWLSLGICNRKHTVAVAGGAAHPPPTKLHARDVTSARKPRTRLHKAAVRTTTFRASSSTAPTLHTRHVSNRGRYTSSPSRDICRRGVHRAHARAWHCMHRRTTQPSVVTPETPPPHTHHSQPLLTYLSHTATTSTHTHTFLSRPPPCSPHNTPFPPPLA